MTLSWPRLRCPAWAARYAGPALRKISATSSEARTGSAWRSHLRLEQCRQLVQRTDDRAHGSSCDRGVESGCLEVRMPEQCLDDPDIDAVFKQMCREAVPQSVWADAFFDTRSFGSIDNDPMELPGTERLEIVHTREQPAIGVHDTLLAANRPPLAQKGKKVSGQERIAIASAFTALHSQEHALAVDIADLQHRHFGGPQASAIRNGQCGLVLQAVGRAKQKHNFVTAEDNGQGARILDRIELAGEIRAINGVREKEPQRRNDAVHGRDANARLALFNLELPELFYGRSIGRAPKICGEPRDVAHIVELGLPREPAHVHVFDHALTQRSGGGIGQNGGHGTTPWLKGAAIVCLLRPDLNLRSGPRSLATPQNKRHSRASGFVLVTKTGGRCRQR